MTARRTPPRGAGAPPPGYGDGHGSAAPKKNDSKALDHFMVATAMISTGDRPSAIIELHKGIRIAGPDLRADLERLLAKVEQVLAAERDQ